MICLLKNFRPAKINFITTSLVHLTHKQLNPKFEYPPLNPDELVEQVTKGGGPGGQKVNKATNCCQLKHIPTGIFVSSHHTRSLEENRKIARRLLQEKLDYHYNKEESFLAKQRAAEREEKLQKKRKSKQKLLQKLEYKQRIQLEDQDQTECQKPPCM